MLLRALLNLLKLVEKEWSHLSGDHWTCPCPIPSPVLVPAFETTGCKISQPEPSQRNKTKPEQQNKSPNQANKNVTLTRIHSLTGLTKRTKMSVVAGEAAAESSAALCRFQLLLSSFKMTA